MRDQPQVVSVAVHFNSPEDCINMIQSLVLMNYTNHRIVVVDNCSEESAFRKLFNYISSLKVSYPCEIIKNTSNVGFGGGINYGFKYAVEKYKSAYLHVINTDAEVINPNYLYDLVTILEYNNNIGIIGPAVLKEDRRELQNTILPFVSLSTALNFKKSFSNLSYIEEHPNILDVECINGVCFVVPATVFHFVGGFDQRYFMYGEEQDLCYSLFKAGYRRVFWSGLSIVHFGAVKKGGNAYVDWRYVAVRKNQIRFLRKYGNFFKAFILATLFSISLLLKFLKNRKILKDESLGAIVGKYFSCSLSAKCN